MSDTEGETFSTPSDEETPVVYDLPSDSESEVFEEEEGSLTKETPKEEDVYLGSDKEEEEEVYLGSDNEEEEICLSSDDEEEKDTESYCSISLRTPLRKRKSFPLCFWYIHSYSLARKVTKKQLENVMVEIFKRIQNLFKIDLEKEFPVHVIQDNKYEDRLRFIFPKIWVNQKSMLHFRTLLLNKLGYMNSSDMIPIAMYIYDVAPKIFLSEKQKFFCMSEKKMTSEEIVTFMNEIGSREQKLTPFTPEYMEFLDQKKQTEEEDCENDLYQLLASEEIVSHGKNLSEEMRKEFGHNFEKCCQWFAQYHPDAKLLRVKEIHKHCYLLDYSKSHAKCALCDLIHDSNRQYLIYNSKSKRAFYCCYDTDAHGKKLICSFKKTRNNVVTL